MSAPLFTERATIELDAERGELVGHNGGWRSDDDANPSFAFLFRFVRDDSFVTCAVPPMRETHEQARARLAAPGAQQRWKLRPEDYGRSWFVECYAVQFSGAWGTEPAWAEWGRAPATMRNPEHGPNRSDSIHVPAATPPPPPPPPPPAEPPWMPHVRAARESADVAVALMEAEGIALDVRRRQRAGMAAAILHADNATRLRAYDALAPVLGWPGRLLARLHGARSLDRIGDDDYDVDLEGES